MDSESTKQIDQAQRLEQGKTKIFSFLKDIPKQVLLFLIMYYQNFLSPLKMGPTCRFIPTCSQYAYEAITKYGAVKGGWMAIKRICKCHPFHPGGYDPVK